MRLPLIFKDGFTNNTPWLRSEVMLLQKALRHSGADLDVDGYYGNDCRLAVEAFQAGNSLEVTGNADGATMLALEPHFEAVSSDTTVMISALMPAFKGDLTWIHLLEGHYGRAYWPGGRSGVTLDPGVDLGHVEPEQVRKLFGGAIADSQYKAMKAAKGQFGQDAKDLLDGDVVLQGIRISRDKADEVMPFAAKPYWRDIADRFAPLREENAYPAVQTVLLSLAYNRGPYNNDLAQLQAPLAAADWSGVADLVGNMQQDHQLDGIRKRRRWEAALIRTHLDRSAPNI